MGTMCSTEGKQGDASGIGGKATFDEQNRMSARASVVRPTLSQVGQHIETPVENRGKKAEAKTTLNVGECEIFLCLGDICEEETICLVHPVDEALNCDLEFSQYILSRAGSKVKSEIDSYKTRNKFKLRIGHIFLTGSGILKAKQIAHLIVPKYITGEMGEDKHLEQAIYSLLKFADEKRLASLSCPIFGVTNGRYPMKTSLKACFGAMNRYFLKHKDDSGIRQIRIISSDEKIVQELVQEGWNMRTEEEFAENVEVGTLATALKDFERVDPFESIAVGGDENPYEEVKIDDEFELLGEEEKAEIAKKKFEETERQRVLKLRAEQEEQALLQKKKEKEAVIVAPVQAPKIEPPPRKPTVQMSREELEKEIQAAMEAKRRFEETERARVFKLRQEKEKYSQPQTSIEPPLAMSGYGMIANSNQTLNASSTTNTMEISIPPPNPIPVLEEKELTEEEREALEAKKRYQEAERARIAKMRTEREELARFAKEKRAKEEEEKARVAREEERRKEEELKAQQEEEDRIKREEMKRMEEEALRIEVERLREEEMIRNMRIEEENQRREEEENRLKEEEKELEDREGGEKDKEEAEEKNEGGEAKEEGENEENVKSVEDQNREEDKGKEEKLNEPSETVQVEASETVQVDAVDAEVKPSEEAPQEEAGIPEESKNDDAPSGEPEKNESGESKQEENTVPEEKKESAEAEGEAKNDSESKVEGEASENRQEEPAPEELNANEEKKPEENNEEGKPEEQN